VSLGTFPSPLFPTYGLEGVSGPGEVFSYHENQPDPAILWNYLLPTRIHGTKFFTRAKDMVFKSKRLEALQSKNDAIIARMIQNRGYYLIHDDGIPNGLPDDYPFPQEPV